MTPLQVKTLLHFYYYEYTMIELRKTPAVTKAVEYLLAEGALEYDPENSEEDIGITPLGRAWMYLILQTPKPFKAECIKFANNYEAVHNDF